MKTALKNLLTNSLTRPSARSATKKSLLAPLVVATGMALASQPAAAGVFSPFEADYTVTRGSLTLGAGHFSLKPWGERDNCYVYHGQAKPRTLLRFITGDIIDDSYFCTEPSADKQGQRLQSQYFSHVEESDDEDSHTLRFDWKANTVLYTGEKAKDGKATLKLPSDAVDPNVLHMAARQWLAQMEDPQKPAQRKFAIVDENEVKHYTLASNPGGVIKTPIGDLDTVKITRIDDPDKQFTLWAAPKLDFLPVQVESKKRDDPIIRLSIKAYRGNK